MFICETTETNPNNALMGFLFWAILPLASLVYERPLKSKCGCTVGVGVLELDHRSLPLAL